MKKILCIAAIATALAMPQLSQAQSYTLLSNDPSGDVTSGTSAKDMKALSYRVNIAQDSIWFKVESYSTINANSDIGLAFGIDTNLVPSSGTTWGGSNNSMKYDHALFVYQNGMFPGYHAEIGTPASKVSLPVNVVLQSPNTLIIRLKLSALDNNKKFNMLAGFGSFDIASTGSVFDDVPNTGVLLVNAATTSVPETATRAQLHVYPNPAGRYVQWDKQNTAGKDLQVRLTDVSGRILRSAAFEQGRMNIADLPAGQYWLQSGNAAAAFTKE